MSICSTGLSDHEIALPGALAADRVYSLSDFAVFAGISLATLRRLIKSGNTRRSLTCLSGVAASADVMAPPGSTAGRAAPPKYENADLGAIEAGVSVLHGVADEVGEHAGL